MVGIDETETIEPMLLRLQSNPSVLFRNTAVNMCSRQAKETAFSRCQEKSPRTQRKARRQPMKVERGARKVQQEPYTWEVSHERV
eukprot:757160-Hanusia_phi.AAC.4